MSLIMFVCIITYMNLSTKSSLTEKSMHFKYNVHTQTAKTVQIHAIKY